MPLNITLNKMNRNWLLSHQSDTHWGGPWPIRSPIESKPSAISPPTEHHRPKERSHVFTFESTVLFISDHTVIHLSYCSFHRNCMQ